MEYTIKDKKLEYKGLVFKLIKEPRLKLVNHIEELKDIGFRAEYLALEKEYVARVKGKEYTLNDIAQILNNSLEFGNQKQITALKAAEAIRLQMTLDYYYTTPGLQ